MNDAALSEAELPDIQGLVTSGYSHLKCSRFVFVQILNPERAREWLAQIVPKITSSARRPHNATKPRFALNIAFTHPGLSLLGLPEAALNLFPREFQEGMASGERPRVLGDSGDSDPEHWDLGAPPPRNAPFHILLLYYAINDDELNRDYQEFAAEFEPAGLKVIYTQDTGRISEKEPFGFRDGISQPCIDGSPGTCPPGETPIAAGEFLLGYRNGYNTVTPSPYMPAALDVKTILRPSDADTSAESVDFGRNGSFLVFRKLAQDVKGFWRCLEAQAALLGMEAGRASAERIAAKIVGRWTSGAPLVLAPNQDDPALATANDFQYMDADADGFACPVGAHIRRANPRDSLQPNPEKSRLLSNRHRLLRRGRHYEERRQAGDTWEPSDVEHGLCFIALNADLQRQFEFIQQTWLNSPKFGGLFDEKDALTGDNDGTGTLSMPGRPIRQRLLNLPRFVRVRGGGYFFLPSLSALRFLANR